MKKAQEQPGVKSGDPKSRGERINEEIQRLIEALTSRLDKRIAAEQPGLSSRSRRELVTQALTSPLQVDLLRATAEHIADAAIRGQFDHLTELYNIAAFERFYESTIEHIEPDKVSAFVVFDIDYFKTINDRHGHPAGDLFLKSVGGVVKEHIRDFDIACRKGGDEFYLLLSNVTPDDIRTIMARIAGYIGAISIASNITSPTISAGCAVIHPGQIMSFSETEAVADRALFVSKIERGRFTMMNGDQYAKYRLDIGKDERGLLPIYTPEISGTTAELKRSPENCLAEVMSGTQRVLEEIKGAFGTELQARLQQEGVADLLDLSLRKIATLLYEARTATQQAGDIS